jgi:AcrR family transcriptional regulator
VADQGSDVGRRHDVLAAVVRLDAERGVNALTLADVADAADVSVGLICHHFRNRAGLLAAAFGFESDRIADVQREAVGRRTALERLVCHVWLRTPAGSASAATPFPVWSFWLDFWALASHQPQVRAQFAPIYETISIPLRQALSDGITAGEFSPRGSPRDLGDRITAMIDGVALCTLLGDIEPDHMLTLLLDGLCLELELDDAQGWYARRIARRLTDLGSER